MRQAFLYVLIILQMFVACGQVYAADKNKYQLDILTDNAIALNIRDDYIYARVPTSGGDKLAVFNKKMEQIIPPIYDYSDASRFGDDGFMTVTEGAEKGRVDTSGNYTTIPLLVPEKYSVEYDLGDGTYLVVEKNTGRHNTLLRINGSGDVLYDFTARYQFISAFQDGVAIASQKPLTGYGGIGVEKYQGKWIDRVYIFNGGSLSVWTPPELDNDFCLINSKGEVLFDHFKLEYNYEPRDGGYSWTLIPLPKNKHGVVKVKRNGMYGIIDYHGKLLRDFDLAEVYSINEYIIAKAADGKNLILNGDGTEALRTDHRFIRFCTVDGVKCFVASLDGKVGVVAMDDSVVIPFEYSDIYQFDNNRLGVKKDGGWGIIDAKNAVIVPAEYKSFSSYPTVQKQYRFIERTDGKYVVFHNDADILPDFIFDKISPCKQFTSLYMVQKDGKFGLFDLNIQKFILPCEYDDILQDNQIISYFQVVKNEKRGLADVDGNRILPMIYDAADNHFYFIYIENKTYAITKENGKFGMICLDDKKVRIPFLYDKLDPSRISGTETELYAMSHWFCAAIGDEWRILNSDGERVTAFGYDNIYKEQVYNENNGVFIANKDDKMCAIYVPSGKVTDFYEYIRIVNEKMLIATKDGKHILTDADGKSYIPFSFDWYTTQNYKDTYAEYQPRSYLLFKSGEKYYCYNMLENTLLTETWDSEKAMYAYVDIHLPGVHSRTQMPAGLSPIREYIYVGSGKTIYLDEDGDAIFYTMNGKTYYPNGEVISDKKEWRPEAIGYQGIFRSYTSGNSVAHTYVAVNRIPQPSAETSGSYICLAVDSPLINIDGEVKTIEKNNYFFKPIIENGNILVPLRVIFEALGADVIWNETTQTITVMVSGNVISLQIGMCEMYVNGKMVWLETPPKMNYDRTLVPLSVVSEALLVNVGWDEEDKTVLITP